MARFSDGMGFRRAKRAVGSFIAAAVALVGASTFAPASPQSRYPLQGAWDIWCERTHNDSGTEAVVHNDGFYVLGYFSIKGHAYPLSANRCYVKNVAAPGRTLRMSAISPTGENISGSCNTTYVGVLNSDVKAGGTVGQDRVGSIASFDVTVAKNAPCVTPMLWMSPGTINGYVHLRESGGNNEYTLPITIIARP